MFYAIIDTETDGLDADRNSLLEVACILYDPERGVLDRKEWIIHYPSSRSELMRTRAPEVVRDMHDTNGLWNMLYLGTPLTTVDDDLAYFLASSKEAYDQRTIYLVGNSCRLDLNFIERHLPLTYEQLHYRSIDLSGIWLASIAAGNEIAFEKASAHRAMSDAEDTLRQFELTLGRMSA